MLAGTAVFCFIFYSLMEYGNVIDAATNAIEDAVKQKWRFYMTLQV